MLWTWMCLFIELHLLKWLLAIKKEECCKLHILVLRMSAFDSPRVLTNFFFFYLTNTFHHIFIFFMTINEVLWLWLKMSCNICHTPLFSRPNCPLENKLVWQTLQDVFDLSHNILFILYFILFFFQKEISK